MTFPQVQAYFAGLVSADAELGPLGAPIQVDPFQDVEAAKTAIDAHLKATGVCVEVGFPWIGAPTTNLAGVTEVEAYCELFVAESITHTHTPNRIGLVNRVITCCTARPSAAQKPARCSAVESVKTEQGWVLHMFTFFVPLNIKPGSS